MGGLRALRWLLRTSNWPCISHWKRSHGVLLLLLHLEVVLEPLLECSLLLCSLLLDN